MQMPTVADFRKVMWISLC